MDFNPGLGHFDYKFKLFFAKRDKKIPDLSRDQGLELTLSLVTIDTILQQCSRL